MKIELTFPNHDKKEFALGTTVLEVAESISLSLKKATVGAKLNNRLIGANEPILESGDFLILTKKDDMTHVIDNKLNTCSLNLSFVGDVKHLELSINNKE